jgi:hypothetical protein
MDTDKADTSETPDIAETRDDSPKKKDGSVTFTIVMMLLALACVGITAAIAFYDMSQ